MYCKKCGVLNDEDAIYCKQCGNVINDKDLTKEKKEEKPKHSKQITKTKVKKYKPKKQKIKQKKVINKDSKKGMTLFQKFFMMILFVLIIIIIGVMSFVGYKYYQNMDKVIVPNVVGLSFDQASAVLNEYDLEVVKTTKKTQNRDEDQIVLNQNKKADNKVLKGSKVKVTVGVYERVILIEDYVGKNIEEIKIKLNDLGLKYIIEEEYNDEYSPGIVTSQNIKEGSKVKEGKLIKLTVSKEKEQEEPVSTNE